MLQDRPKGYILLVTLILIVKFLSSARAGVINGSNLVAASTETSVQPHFDGAGIKMSSMLLPADRARSKIALKELDEKTENHISTNFEIVKINAGDHVKIDSHETALITKSDSGPENFALKAVAPKITNAESSSEDNSQFSKNVMTHSQEAAEMISNKSFSREPLDLQGKNSSTYLDKGSKIAQTVPTSAGESLQSTRSLAALEDSTSTTTAPTTHVPNILADIIKSNHSHAIMYNEEIFGDVLANTATNSEHVQPTTIRNTIAMSLPHLIMQNSKNVSGNAATALKKLEEHVANNTLIKTSSKNELEDSNEIYSTTSKTSTAKRAKLINDNSTNTNQLNLPDASEVWTLVGMKTVPLKHTTVLPEAKINDVAENNSVRNINNSISSSNSDKNLLDWTQIMINEDLDAKNLDNIINTNANNNVGSELKNHVDILRSKETPSLVHTNKTTLTHPENSFVENRTLSNANTKLTALLAPVTATTLNTFDSVGTAPKTLSSSTANEANYISPTNGQILTTFAPNLSFTTTVNFTEKKDSDKSNNKASVAASNVVSVEPTRSTLYIVNETRFAFPNEPAAESILQSASVTPTTVSPTAIIPSTAYPTTVSPIIPSLTTASPTTGSPTTAAYNFNSSTYHLPAPTQTTFGPATTFPPSLSVDNENKASLIAVDKYDESTHANNIESDTTTQLPLLVLSTVDETSNIALETTTTKATKITENNSHLELPTQSTANAEKATIEKSDILSESVRKQPLPANNFSTSLQPPPANRSNDNNNEVTLKTINNNNNNNNDEHANVNVVGKEATLVLLNSVSTTVSSSSKAGAVNISALTENFDFGATTTDSRVEVDFGTSVTTERFPTVSSTVEDLFKTEIGETQTTSSENPLFLSTTTSTLFQDTQKSTTSTGLSSQLIDTTTIFSLLPTANSRDELVTQIHTEGKHFEETENKTLMNNSIDMNSLYPLEKNITSKGSEPTQMTESSHTTLGITHESNDVELLPLTSTAQTPTKEMFTISTTTEMPLISLLDDYTTPVIATQDTTDEKNKLPTTKTTVVTMGEIFTISTTTEMPLISLLDDYTTPVITTQDTTDEKNKLPTTKTPIVTMRAETTTTTTKIASPPAVTSLPKIYEVSATSVSSTLLPITFETSNNAGGIDDSHLHPDSVDAPEMDVNVIIAISISVIGIVALILLVAFLYMVRKRQKQMSYGHRCRPVSLDAYSMDNVSVYNSVRRKGAMRSSKRSYGNAAFDDPSLTHNVLNATELATFIERRSAIFEEFKYVPQIIARPDEVPQGCEDKNRYANVIPIPETRVSLQQQNDNERSEYINANYVRGPKDSPNYYIACQAPLESTVTDFWRMIWEQNSRVIIQATDLVENGIEKCAEYLPPSVTLDNHTTYGDFQVTLKNREVKDKYAISTIILKNTAANSSRELTHYWYKWPEAGVPNEEAPIIAMLLEARSSLKSYAVEQANDIKETTQKTIPNLDSRNEIENEVKKQSSIPSLEYVSENKEKSSVADAKNEININPSSDKLKTGANYQGPLTVHCSPGTGRSGTIIACDIAIRSLETQKRTVDVPQIVYYVRRGRASAVQTKEQYEFIYKIACMYASKITNVLNDN